MHGMHKCVDGLSISDYVFTQIDAVFVVGAAVLVALHANPDTEPVRHRLQEGFFFFVS